MSVFRITVCDATTGPGPFDVPDWHCVAPRDTGHSVLGDRTQHQWIDEGHEDERQRKEKKYAK